MQIVQELCKRPGLNRTGFEMPTIYLPDEVSKVTTCTLKSIKLLNVFIFQFSFLFILKPTRCANQIDEVCAEINKTIDHTIQHALNNLEKDCDSFRNKVQARLKLDKETRDRNWTKTVRSKYASSDRYKIILRLRCLRI